MYSAIVKKRIENQTKKQWLLFDDGKFSLIDKERAHSYRATILIYSKTYANHDEEMEFEDD